MTQISIAQAQTRFPELVHQAETGEPVYITQSGQPVVVLLSAEEYRRMRGGDKKRNFWEEIQEMRAAPDFEPVDITEKELAEWRGQGPEREFSWKE